MIRLDAMRLITFEKTVIDIRPRISFDPFFMSIFGFLFDML